MVHSESGAGYVVEHRIHTRDAGRRDKKNLLHYIPSPGAEHRQGTIPARPDLT
ncbi:hypothetical protein [Methanosarcina siciliae]|uniref:hypothetical protein n=1 Tax=Methanosarcina siciliae TaxID=38027 RepID=UPI0012E01D4F|nr:hypothetical protein [Methanosarcina siciliae]